MLPWKPSQLCYIHKIWICFLAVSSYFWITLFKKVWLAVTDGVIILSEHLPFSDYLSSFSLWKLYNYRTSMMNWHYTIHDKDNSWISCAEWMWSQEISTRTVWLLSPWWGANSRIVGGAAHPVGGRVAADLRASRSENICMFRLWAELF